MHDRKDYYYDPVNHYYTYDPDGYYAFRAQAQNDFSEGQAGGDGPGNNERRKRDNKKEKKTVQLTRSKLAALMLVMVMIAGLAGFGGAKLAGAGKITLTQENAVTSTGYNLQEATGSKMTVQQIAKKCQESVVSIKTESIARGSWIREYVTEGAGSGVIFKSNGYILTNNHVVEGARKVTVSVDSNNGKTKTYDAKIIGTDAANDVAVIKINAKGLTAASLGKSDSLSVGDMAVVVGNPLGELGDSVSAGIISSTSRKITVENRQMNLIQTDASINPGNSGGGLFNGSGQLIGLVEAKSSGTGIEGLGFAIPINKVLKSAQNIMSGKVNDNANDQNSQSTDQYDPFSNGYNNGGNSGGSGNDDFWSDDWFDLF